ncbi:MAG: 4Fe-4S binding protein [Anaerolineae bacterium]|nr:4Fe-4S binding protein [Anaerolineae bacterium]
MAVRHIIKIDEELCNGCGACVTPCAEGAIVLENGKARVVDDALCDGAGFCIPVCPTGALSIETREAPAFDEARAAALMVERGTLYIAQRCFRCKVSEDKTPLMPFRHRGESLWVCTRCLPTLIHG